MNVFSRAGRRIILIAMAATGVCAAADPDPSAAPAMDQYAWGFPIQTDAEASFYAVELPLAFYQSVSDLKLRDAGVYNGAGQPVPRVFKPTPKLDTKAELSIALSAVPLQGQSAQQPEALRLMFEREGENTRIEINDQAQSSAELSPTIAYIIDLRQVDQILTGIQLSWERQESGFIGRVSVDGSSNLASWRTRGNGAVADLQQAGTQVLQDRISLRSGSDDFLRIRWTDLPPQWRLTSVKGLYPSGETTLVRRQEDLVSTGTDPQDGGYLYDLGGAPMVDRLQVQLAQPNSIISASLYYWSEPRQDWQLLNSGPHYYLGRDDNSIRSSAVTIPRTAARRFKLLVDQGQPGSPPQLTVGWRPDTLLFLAQGQAPFTLAAGRSADAAEQYPQQRLYGDSSIVTLAQDRADVASLGSRRALGGSTDLQPATPLNWRRLLLWLGLAVGVLFVGLMAVKVVKEMRTH